VRLILINSKILIEIDSEIDSDRHIDRKIDEAWLIGIVVHCSAANLEISLKPTCYTFELS